MISTIFLVRPTPHDREINILASAKEIIICTPYHGIGVTVELKDSFVESVDLAVVEYVRHNNGVAYRLLAGDPVLWRKTRIHTLSKYNSPARREAIERLIQIQPGLENLIFDAEATDSIVRKADLWRDIAVAVEHYLGIGIYELAQKIDSTNACIDSVPMFLVDAIANQPYMRHLAFPKFDAFCRVVNYKSERNLND